MNKVNLNRIHVVKEGENGRKNSIINYCKDKTHPHAPLSYQILKKRGGKEILNERKYADFIIPKENQ